MTDRAAHRARCRRGARPGGDVYDARARQGRPARRHHALQPAAGMTWRRALVALLVGARHRVGSVAGCAGGTRSSPRRVVGARRRWVAVSNLTRVETWRFFEPPSLGGGSRLHLLGQPGGPGVRVRARGSTSPAAFSYVRVEELPTKRDRSRRARHRRVLLRLVRRSLQLPGVSHVSVRILARRRPSPCAHGRPHAIHLGCGGRAPLVSPASNSLLQLRRLAIDGRLVGTFDWSFYQRRFDGVQADWRGDSHGMPAAAHSW